MSSKNQLNLSSFLEKGILSSDPLLEIPKLKRKIWNNFKNNQKYFTIRYNKSELLTNDYLESGLLRSLIINAKLSKVVSFCPPKSFNYHKDQIYYNDIFKNQDIYAEEFVDGTMINLFWDENIQVPGKSLKGDWEIATKSCVGGNIGFYLHNQSKTFRQMFLEASNDCNFDFNLLPRYSGNNNQLSYSFVLQHKENRIVVPYKKNSIYLIDVYEIEQKEELLNIHLYDKQLDKENIYKKCSNIGISFPTIYENNVDSLDKINNLIHLYGSRNTAYYIQGFVLKAKHHFSRFKIRNPNYEEVRRIRGNEPKIQFRYLTLRQQGKLKDYLKYYPEDGKVFSLFRKQLHDYTNTLYINYVNCFIKKLKPILEFPYKYRNHMVELHKHFINNLRPEKYITKNEVIQYINNLTPPQQMFVLNFDMRKRNIDSIKAERSLLVEAD